MPCHIAPAALAAYARLDRPFSHVDAGPRYSQFLNVLGTLGKFAGGTVDNISYVPVSVACKGDRPEGRVRFIARYATHFVGSGYRENHEIEKYVDLVVRDGVPFGPVFEFARRVGTTIRSDDPEKQAEYDKFIAKQAYSFVMSKTDRPDGSVEAFVVGTNEPTGADDVFEIIRQNKENVGKDNYWVISVADRGRLVVKAYVTQENQWAYQEFNVAGQGGKVFYFGAPVIIR